MVMFFEQTKVRQFDGMGKIFHSSFAIPIFFRFFAMSNATDACGKHIRNGVVLTLYLRNSESRKFQIFHMVKQ